MTTIARLAAALAVIALTACPRERTVATLTPVPADASATTAPIDARPAEVPYVRAAETIAAPALTAATLDWNRTRISERELEALVDDLELDALQARLGTFVVRLDRAHFDAYDAKTRTLTFIGAGLEGVQTEPPLAFTAVPSITRGEMPLGGHARLDIGTLRGAVSVDAARAQALLALDAADPLAIDFLVELDHVTSVDGATVYAAHLRGVRVVREGAHEFLLEGTVTSR
ncbi:MAG: hypothetical protein K8W52_46860 [Deltaproteobacteria bacterium]|nr:hypothetical protein [Deltaproteobacteria bacterium]